MKMVSAGVKVGLGVDGSASNDSSHLLAEARQAMLLARLDAGLQGASLSLDSAPPLMSARQALELATLGGAAVLGRQDIGALAPGMCADFIALDLNRLDYAGALHDPVAAALFCSPLRVDYNIVGGETVVDHGNLAGLEMPALIDSHNEAAQALITGG